MKRNATDIPTGPAPHPAGGFTLIEMMITMVVLAILGAIAIPIYQSQVRESRRTDARTALLELAAREERYYATNNAYTADPASLGYSGFGTKYPVGNGYYYLDTPTFSNTASPPSFSLEAQPEPGTDQVNDAACTTFSVDSTGAQTATGSGTNSSSACWGP